MTVTFTLTPQDTLPGLLAKLRAASAERVLFVVPSDLALDAVALRVLRREAAVARIGLALVTQDPGLRSLAAREGISTFRSQARGERARWRRPRGDRQPRVAAVTPPGVSAPYAASLFGKRSPSGFRPSAYLRAFTRRPSPWWATLGLTLGLMALFGGLLYALALFIPAATITVTPASEPIQISVPLQAIQGARADATAGIVPAQVLSVQVSGEARTETTGRRAEPATKSTGRVVLINRTQRQIDVPVGTTVSTATGDNVQFVTTVEVSLVPNGRAAVPVEALLPGPSGNVRAGTVTRVEGSLALSLVVANEKNFSGGTTAQVGVVTEDDKARLEALLFEQLKTQALERLNERAGSGRLIPPESVNYVPLSPTFTPFVGEVSPELFLRMSVQAVSLVVDQTAVREVGRARLQAAMPAGTRLISDTMRFVSGPVQQVDAATVAFDLTVGGALLRGVDTEQVRSAVLGLPPAEAQRVLQQRFSLPQPPDLHLGPDWLPYVVPISVPTLPWRIRVVVDWDAGAQLAMAR